VAPGSEPSLAVTVDEQIEATADAATVVYHFPVVIEVVGGEATPPPAEQSPEALLHTVARGLA
jgi:hypothetical protein